MNRKSVTIKWGKCGNGNSFIKHYLFQQRILFKTLILFVSTFIMLSSTSFATQKTLAGKDANRLQSGHSFEIGPVFNYFEYKESDVDWTGNMAGVMGKYTYCSPTGFIFSAELEYTQDLDVEYDGQTQSGTPVKEDSKVWIVEPRLITGGRLQINKHSIINPYFGLGYRYWYDNIEGVGSYKRITEYLYLPIGTNFTHKVSENFKWGITLEFDFFLWGRNKSYLSDVDPGFNDLKLDQDSGYGLRASLPCTYRFLQIEPYIYYWDIGKSDIDFITYYGIQSGWYAVEPDNETTVYGIRLSFLF
ncbi:MAG: hypothetical protein ABIK92_08795 [Pseudomonadota bacterium]